MIKILTTFLFFTFTASANLNDAQKQHLVTQNQLVNGGFENGKQTWTASGGTFAIATSGSNLLSGLSSATWDSNGAAQTLRTALQTVPNGLKGRPGVALCNILVPSGTATHTLSLSDGTNTLASETVISNSNPVKTYAFFQYPTSGSVRLVLTSVAADEPSITIDDCYIGPADGVALTNAKTQDVFSARITNAGTPTVATQNVSWISSLTDNSTGDTTVNFNSGIFTQAPHCTCTSENATAGRYCQVDSTTATTSSLVRIQTTTDTGTTDDHNFILNCQSAGVDSPSVAYKPDTIANSWSGYFDSTCSFTRANTAFGDLTDASCALVERTNRNFGTVTSNASTNLGIVFTPKRAGKYHVCAYIKVEMGTAGSQHTQRLWDGTTVIAESQGEVNQGSPSDTMTFPLCGQYTASSTAAVTLSVQTKSTAGTTTITALDSSTAVEWSIFQIDQSVPAPVIPSSVSTPAQASTKFVAAMITNSGTPTVTRQNGTWITAALTDNGVGDTSIPITAGTFSATPYCWCTVENATIAQICQIDPTTALSSTLVRVQTGNDSGAATDVNFHIFCVGTP